MKSDIALRIGTENFLMKIAQYGSSSKRSFQQYKPTAPLSNVRSFLKGPTGLLFAILHNSLLQEMIFENNYFNIIILIILQIFENYCNLYNYFKIGEPVSHKYLL